MDNFNARLKRLLGREEIPCTEVEPISFWVCCPESGWMDARLKIQGDIFPICFSSVYPPFHDMVTWIENIIIENITAPVFVNDEFDEHYFNVVETGNSERIIFEYLRFSFPGTGIYRKALVSRRALAAEFYRVFKFLMLIDFQLERDREEGRWVYFDFDPDSDDIVRFDLSKIASYLHDGE